MQRRPALSPAAPGQSSSPQAPAGELEEERDSFGFSDGVLGRSLQRCAGIHAHLWCIWAGEGMAFTERMRQKKACASSEAQKLLLVLAWKPWTTTSGGLASLMDRPHGEEALRLHGQRARSPVTPIPQLSPAFPLSLPRQQAGEQNQLGHSSPNPTSACSHVRDPVDD